MDASSTNAAGGGSANSSRDTSSSSSSSHNQLLSTVLELRGDLEKTMTKMAQLSEQNQALSSNYQVLKDELVDTRRKYNEARENYLTTVEEKIELERASEAFMDRLKIQLTEKTKEFESLRDKFAPQDIDYVRIKVQEELEIPHRQKLQAMDKEVQRHKEEFFSMRRELEKSKAEYEAYSQNQQREVTAIRDEHQGVVLILRDQIARLQEASRNLEKDEQLRAKTMKVHELQRMLDLTKEECRALTAERETLSASLGAVRLKTDEAVERLRDKAIVAEAGKAGAEERLSHTVSECDRKDALMRAARQAQEEMATQLDHTRRLLSAAEAQNLSLRAEHSREVEDMAHAFQAERTALLEQLEHTSAKMHSAIEGQRRAQRETVEIQVRTEAQESEARRAHLAAVQQLHKKIHALELQQADAERAVRVSDESRNAALESSSVEAEVLRSELARFKREKEMLHDKLRELEHAVEGERRKVTALKREQSSRKEYFDVDLREERARIAALETEVTLAKIREAELSSHKGEVERKVADQATVIEGLQQEARTRLLSVTNLYKEKVEAMKAKLKMALAQERKRAEAYKGKALQAHQRGKELLQSMAHGDLGETS